MGQYYSIMMRTHHFDKIIDILEQYTESLDNYFEIEECVNLIHLVQEEIYKYQQEQRENYENIKIKEAELRDFADWVWKIAQEYKLDEYNNSYELLQDFYNNFDVYKKQGDN